MWLQRCVPIQPRGLQRGPTLILGDKVRFQFIQKVSDKVEVRALWRPVQFFDNKEGNHFILDQCMEALSCSKRKKRSNTSTVSTKLKAHCISLYAVTLRFPLIETRGPKLWQTAAVCGEGCPHIFGHLVYLLLVCSRAQRRSKSIFQASILYGRVCACALCVVACELHVHRRSHLAACL